MEVVKMKINIKSAIISLAVITALAIVFFAINVGVKNHVIALEENANNSKANVGSQEKRRVDLVYNLADSVKSYADFEHKTQMDVIAKRTSEGTIDSNGGAAVNIKAVAEAYPDLKASAQYQQLMTELAITENQVFNYRTIYNDAIREYNSYVRKWPANMIIDSKDIADFKYLEFDTPSDAPKNLFDRK
jgi:LemA protein